MRIRIGLSVISAIASGFISFASSVKEGGLSPSQWADTEISTNVAFSVWREGQKRFDFSLSFLASPSNNVQAAFGVDDNHDGILSLDEDRFVIGWDCGEWFVAVDGRRIASPDSMRYASGKRSLRCLFDTRSDGSRESVSISAADQAIFRDDFGSDAFPYEKGWNIFRLTARGVDEHSAFFESRNVPRGVMYILR